MPAAATGVRTRYEVRDRSGVHIATHVRIVEQDGSKRFIWAQPDGHANLPQGVGSSDLPLYGIEKVLGPMVVITEGEKACEALWARDIVAVATVTGSSATPSMAALAELTGLRVYLWPDNDEVGRNHMMRVAEGLKNVASSVVWVIWPGAPEHGDAADVPANIDVWEYLNDAGPVPTSDAAFERKGMGYVCRFPAGQVEISVDLLLKDRKQLHGELVVTTADPMARGDGNLIQSTFNLSSEGTRTAMAKALKERAPNVHADWREYLEVFCRKVLAAEREGQPIVLAGGRKAVAVQGITYDLFPMLPLRRPTLVFGPPGAGKSHLAAALLVAYCTGRMMLDWRMDGQPGRALVIDYEDDQDAWDARIAKLANGLGIEPPSYFYSHPAVSLTEETERYARFCSDQDIGLVILDSVGMASPSGHEGVDANDSTIRLFKAMNMIGRTSVLIDHVTKNDARSDRAVGPYGSQYKTAMARQSWEVRRIGEDTDDGEVSFGHMAIYDAKRNHSGKRHPLGVRIEYRANGVVLIREELHVAERREGMTTRDLIWDALSHGPMKPADIAELTGEGQGNIRQTLLRMTNAELLVRLPSGEYARRAREEDQP